MKKSIGIIIIKSPKNPVEDQDPTKYLIYLLKGFIDADIHVSLLCPSWLYQDIYNLCDKNYFTLNNKVDILSPKQIPPAYFINEIYKKLLVKLNSKKASPIQKFVDRIFIYFGEKMPILMGTSSWISFTNNLIFILVFIPLLMIQQFIVILKPAKPQIIINKNIIRNSIISIWFTNLYYNIYYTLIENESRKISKIAKKCKDFDRWIIPTPSCPEVVNSLPNSIFICPDILFDDFTVGIITESSKNYQDGIIQYRNRLISSLKWAKKIVTYSNSTKQLQLCNYLSVSPDKISVIPHAPVDLSNNLDKIHLYQSLNPIEQNDLCLQIVHDYFNVCDNPYLRDFDITGVKFLVYSSQYRVNKNFDTLFRCIYSIIHLRNQPIKLILAANKLDSIPRLTEFINKNALSMDIIILSNIPDNVKAALYHLSTLAINPSFYEGSFPFTFSEAYSVGTPSLMSSIPVVMETIEDPILRKTMLFDPTNYLDMADKICWGLDNYEQLYNLQSSLYEKMKSRSWKNVAEDYYNLIV